jgi:hypothetical protein
MSNIMLFFGGVQDKEGSVLTCDVGCATSLRIEVGKESESLLTRDIGVANSPSHCQYIIIKDDESSGIVGCADIKAH